MCPIPPLASIQRRAHDGIPSRPPATVGVDVVRSSRFGEVTFAVCGLRSSAQFRFKVEIEFDGRMIVQNYLNRKGREGIYEAFRTAADSQDDRKMEALMVAYGAHPRRKRIV